MTKSIGVCNSIGGTLTVDSTSSGDKVAEWSFEFNQADKALQLKVHLSNSQVLTGPDELGLGTALEKDDVNQLIQWLYAVKSNML